MLHVSVRVARSAIGFSSEYSWASSPQNPAIQPNFYFPLSISLERSLWHCIRCHMVLTGLKNNNIFLLLAYNIISCSLLIFFYWFRFLCFLSMGWYSWCRGLQTDRVSIFISRTRIADWSFSNNNSNNNYLQHLYITENQSNHIYWKLSWRIFYVGWNLVIQLFTFEYHLEICYHKTKYTIFSAITFHRFFYLKGFMHIYSKILFTS